MDKVMRAYQARQVRTWYWSSPAPPLACCRHSSCDNGPAPVRPSGRHPDMLGTLLLYVAGAVLAGLWPPEGRLVHSAILGHVTLARAEGD